MSRPFSTGKTVSSACLSFVRRRRACSAANGTGTRDLRRLLVVVDGGKKDLLVLDAAEGVLPVGQEKLLIASAVEGGVSCMYFCKGLDLLCQLVILARRPDRGPDAGLSSEVEERLPRFPIRFHNK